MANELLVVGLMFFMLVLGALVGYLVAALVETPATVDNQSDCYSIPRGYINLSRGARLEGVTLYNLTLYAADDNYSMRSVYGKDFTMYVNGTRIR